MSWSSGHQFIAVPASIHKKENRKTSRISEGEFATLRRIDLYLVPVRFQSGSISGAKNANQEVDRSILDCCSDSGFASGGSSSSKRERVGIRSRVWIVVGNNFRYYLSCYSNLLFQKRAVLQDLRRLACTGEITWRQCLTTAPTREIPANSYLSGAARRVARPGAARHWSDSSFRTETIPAPSARAASCPVFRC